MDPLKNAVNIINKETKSEFIAGKNDTFRKLSATTGFGLLVTKALVELFPEPEVDILLKKVADFDSFSEDNDPYGEHDFGSLEFGDSYTKVFWKIDYYDEKMEYGLEPTDPNVRRILTVMLADDYWPHRSRGGNLSGRAGIPQGRLHRGSE